MAVHRVWLGDRVKVTNPDPKRSRFAGMVGLIERIEAETLDSDGAAPLMLDLGFDGNCWFRPDELTAVPGPTPGPKMDLLPLLQDFRFRLYADDGETPVVAAHEPDSDGHRYRYVDAPGHDFVLAPLLNDDHTAALDYWITHLEAGTHMPRRDDPVHAWLKEHAASLFPHRFMTTGRVGYDLLEDLIDAYTLCADTGTPLGEHACTPACVPGVTCEAVADA